MSGEGEVTVADAAAEAAEDPQGGEDEGEVEIPELEEDEIQERMGYIPDENEKLDGVGEFFVNATNMVRMGLKDNDEQEEGRKYVYVKKQEALDECAKFGFQSDWNDHRDLIKKYPHEDIILVRDPERVYGQNYAWGYNGAGYKTLHSRIQEQRQAVIDAHIAEFQREAGGAGGEGGGAEGEDEEENVVVEDRPITPRPWHSESALKHFEEVDSFTVKASRPLLRVSISKKRRLFGAPWKFIDFGDNVQGVKQNRSEQYVIVKKRELDIGVQAVPQTTERAAQTTWNRSINASCQYNATDFLHKNTDDESEEENKKLVDFLHKFGFVVEEALQQNETFDIYHDELAHLGDDDLGIGSKSQSNMREIRNLHDLTFSKNKRITSIAWVPGSNDLIAISCVDNLSFDERIELSGRAQTAVVMIWSLADSIHPQAALESQAEVNTLSFWPSDRQFLLGGCLTGQVVVWKLDAVALGSASDKRRQMIEADKTHGVPKLGFLKMSEIEFSHSRVVTDIQWFPEGVEFDRRKGLQTKPGLESHRFFLTASGDGQLLVWNWAETKEKMLDLKDDASRKEMVWVPYASVQISRRDSGCEMSLSSIRLATPEEGEERATTKLWAATEDGEVALIDWGAKAEEGQKPEYVKKVLDFARTWRPSVAFERSPFFPDIFLHVTDWNFFLWKERGDLWKESSDNDTAPLFQSPTPMAPFTCGTWSTARPCVLFIGRMDGQLEIWDFADQSHRSSLFHSVASVALSSIAFQSPTSVKPSAPKQHAGGLKVPGTGNALSQGNGPLLLSSAVGNKKKDTNPVEVALQQMAIGDENGNLHVLELPKSMKKAIQNEQKVMRLFLEREAERCKYQIRRATELEKMKEEHDRMMLMQSDQDDGAADPNSEQEALRALQEEYEGLERLFREELGLPQEKGADGGMTPGGAAIGGGATLTDVPDHELAINEDLRRMTWAKAESIAREADRRVEQLGSAYDVMATENSSLKTRNDVLSDRLSALERDVTTLRASLNDKAISENALKADVVSLDTASTRLRSENDVLARENVRLQAEVDRLTICRPCSPCSPYRKTVVSTITDPVCVSPSLRTSPSLTITTPALCTSPCATACATTICTAPSRCERIEWPVFQMSRHLLSASPFAHISKSFRCSRLGIERIELDFYPCGAAGAPLSAGTVFVRWATGEFRHDFPFLREEISSLEDCANIQLDLFSCSRYGKTLVA
uniref:Uncharacterized protein n=1 Tax=Chromera velia CCMP2878 TaxID=1169474 RepID=A0A0G4FYU7_9ALVE|eukprot:Cvel_19327.t1-p1 / transcript=Cvel_19327.t1 / gene=Cvel_19327 / organism=Chromera_velia_CCMP2878 / gene_product=WD repeat-containing protein 63, putative / transcript_product=WD repeat-containing protein 63, putative / location=Cvel_scaffold1658:17842-34602(-) / protein_length=1218 / sequence_SO=supercontig / SO=protein_coding / is_pseudo=false